MSVGAAVGFGMDPIEGLYLVALASVFCLIPSGPAYAGTQDTAVAIGIKAIGGTGSIAVAYLLMLRFVIVVPITRRRPDPARHPLRRAVEPARGARRGEALTEVVDGGPEPPAHAGGAGSPTRTRASWRSGAC